MKYYFYRRDYKLTRNQKHYYWDTAKRKTYVFETDNCDFIDALVTGLNITEIWCNKKLNNDELIKIIKEEVSEYPTIKELKINKENPIWNTFN